MHKQKYKLSNEDKSTLALAGVLIWLGFFIGVLFSLIVFQPLKVHAAESGQYTLSYSVLGKRNTVNTFYEDTTVTFKCDTPLFMYKTTSSSGFTAYYVGSIKNGKASNDNGTSLVSKNFGIQVTAYSSKAYNISDGKFLDESTIEDASYNGVHLVSYRDDSGATFSCTGFVFDSLESAQAYYTTGDDSGVLFKPPADRIHDSKYDGDIPVPVLNGLSHDGFTVANISEDLYLDIIVKSTFYGLKHETTKTFGFNTDFFNPDTSWVYNTHEKDLTWEEDIPRSQETVSLLSDFGYNNVGLLYEDGVNYFKAFPKHKNLPDYDTWEHLNKGYTTEYTDNRVFWFNLSYEPDMDVMMSALKMAESASTEFYVRFYTYGENGVGISYGQWVCYQIDGTHEMINGEMFGTQVTISPIETDNDGNMIKVDTTTGRIDEDGNLQYVQTGNTWYDVQNSDSFFNSVESFIGDLESFENTFAGFSELLAGLFVFIPEWIWKLIGTGITAALIVMVIRVLRG